MGSRPGTPRSGHSIRREVTPSSSSVEVPVRLCGESLACLVGASVTVVDGCVYVLGGFDRYSDEVFHTLFQLRVDEGSPPYAWTRMTCQGAQLMARSDHSATLWRHERLVVFGGTGDDDHDAYFTQVAILHLPTMTWELPRMQGMVPLTGRIKHSATIQHDILYIAGGLEPGGQYADTVLAYNLSRNEWLPPIPFVRRSQHMSFFYNKRLYVYGGYNEDLTRSNNALTFLDTATHAVTHLEIESPSAPHLHGQQYAQICGDQLVVVVMDHDHCDDPLDDDDEDDDDEEDEGSEMEEDATMHATRDEEDEQDDQEDQDEEDTDMDHAQEPMTLRSSQGTRPNSRASRSRSSTSIGSRRRRRRHNKTTRKRKKKHARAGVWHLDLTSMQWQEHKDIPLQVDGHWQVFVMQEHADWFALFGAPDDDLDEYYGIVLRILLREHGIVAVPPSRLGTDLAGLLQDDDGQASADFVIRSGVDPDAQELHVHRLVLIARWPHFAHLMQAGMVESFSNSVTLPEPHDVLRGFVHFLYTDALDDTMSPLLVADLMVMANLYMLPRLLALTVRRLYGCISVDYCSKIYHAAVQAGQDGLQQTALTFIFRHFGLVVQSPAFHLLPHAILAELLDQIPYYASIAIPPPSLDTHQPQPPNANTSTMSGTTTPAVPPPPPPAPPARTLTPELTTISGRSTPNQPRLHHPQPMSQPLHFQLQQHLLYQQQQQQQGMDNNGHPRSPSPMES